VVVVVVVVVVVAVTTADILHLENRHCPVDYQSKFWLVFKLTIFSIPYSLHSDHSMLLMY